MSHFQTPQPIAVKSLRFDPENPRFPEGTMPQDDATILREMRDEWVIDELANSMLDHGYFAQEPLLVLDEPDAAGRYVVLEGNRRLAALKMLHEQGDEYDPPPTTEQLERLREVPCIRVQDRSSVWAYLGFRHIGGIKEWSPASKARFVTEAVERAWRSAPDQDPFKSVGRAFGSNAMGMRSAFVAFMVLRHARDEASIATHEIVSDRFGVWTRLLNSPEVRKYIGLSDARFYPDVLEAVHNVDVVHLEEVLGDLTERGGRPALLRDSRQTTEYGRVLASDRARAVLRETRDLDTAAMVIQDVSLTKRLERVARQLGALRKEVLDLNTVTSDIVSFCKEISDDSRSMYLDVKERAEEGD
jgi:hypothetical protein